MINPVTPDLTAVADAAERLADGHFPDGPGINPYAAPLARSLAAVLRAVAGWIMGADPVIRDACTATVLAAVEPLLPLLGVELERIESDRTTSAVTERENNDG